jgi:hypothetical protein
MDLPLPEKPQMSLMQTIVNQLLHQLVEDKLLELAEGSSIDELEGEILEALSGAPGFSQATPFLVGSIVASTKVSELYATDEQMREIMSHLMV